MAVELVTGYKGKDHVTAEQWADFNRGIFGDAAILPVGNKMETAIQTANQITIKDGVAVIDGRQIYIGYGESENIAIQSGTQGMARRDIVVLEYTRNEDTGVEEVHFKVVTGTPTSGSAKDPAINNMDIRTGVSVSQKPFCRVRVNGTAIEGVDSMVPLKELSPHAFAAVVDNLESEDENLALSARQGMELKKMIDIAGANALNIMLVASESVTLEAGTTKALTIKYKCPKEPKIVIAQADGGAPFECSVSSWGKEQATVGVKSTEKLTNRKVRLIIFY